MKKQKPKPTNPTKSRVLMIQNPGLRKLQRDFRRPIGEIHFHKIVRGIKDTPKSILLMALRQEQVAIIAWRRRLNLVTPLQSPST